MGSSMGGSLQLTSEEGIRWIESIISISRSVTTIETSTIATEIAAHLFQLAHLTATIGSRSWLLYERVWF